MFSTCGQFESRKPNAVLFFFQTQHRFLHKKHLLLYIYANFINFVLGNLLIWNERATLNVPK